LAAPKSAYLTRNVVLPPPVAVIDAGSSGALSAHRFLEGKIDFDPRPQQCAGRRRRECRLQAAPQLPPVACEGGRGKGPVKKENYIRDRIIFELEKIEKRSKQLHSVIAKNASFPASR
jgi:hypothetical protein